VPATVFKAHGPPLHIHSWLIVICWLSPYREPKSSTIGHYIYFMPCLSSSSFTTYIFIIIELIYIFHIHIVFIRLLPSQTGLPPPPPPLHIQSIHHVFMPHITRPPPPALARSPPPFSPHFLLLHIFSLPLTVFIHNSLLKAETQPHTVTEGFVSQNNNTEGFAKASACSPPAGRHRRLVSQAATRLKLQSGFPLLKAKPLPRGAGYWLA